MKNKQTVLYIYLFLSIVAIMVGCNSKLNDEKQAQLSLINQTNPTPINLTSQPTQESSRRTLKKMFNPLIPFMMLLLLKEKIKLLWHTRLSICKDFI